MKKLLKCISLAAAVFILLAGCNNLGISDATVSGLGASESVKEGYCALALTLDGFLDSEDRSIARNINPTTLDPNAAENDFDLIDHYVLKGESSTGTNLGTDGVVLGSEEAPASGTSYKVKIPYGAWELTLFAYDENNNLLLKGKSFVELKTTKSSVHFTLKTDGVTTFGHVNLAGTFTDGDDVAKTYKAGLYNNLTGLLIPGTEVVDTVDTVGTVHSFTFAPKTAVDPENPDAEQDPLDLLPGRYSFLIKFYNVATVAEVSDSSQPIGSYDELVVIAPGRTTTNTSISCGKIINQLPNSPKNLRAYRKNNSDDADGYTVILTWEDDSKNEENFVIYLDEYTSDADDAAVRKTIVLGTEAADETAVNGVAVVKQNFFTSDMYAGGSVNASSTTASLKLEFGKVYDVSIRAKNFVGESIKTKASADPAVAEVKACPRVVEANTLEGATQYTSARINRFVIEYDLNGGELTLGDNTKTSDNKFVYASIYDYENEDAKLLVSSNSEITPVLDRITDPSKLIKNGNPFVSWVKENGSTIGTGDKITYEGIKVKAEYDPHTLISSEIDDTYKTITASAKYNNIALEDGVVPVNVADVKDLTIVAKASNPDKIDSVKITVKGQKNLPTYNKKYSGTELATEVSYTIEAATITEMPSGIYTVTVEVHLDGENNSKTYKVSFPIDIQK